MDGIVIPWVIACTILLFVAAYWIYTLEKRLATLGERYETLLEIPAALEKAPDQPAFVPLLQRLDQHGGRLDATESAIGAIRRTMPHVVQGLGALRYNAFEGVGGDQSFSVALADAEGHGVVLSGLHSGDVVRVYAKPFENWKSSHSLSENEQAALAVARERTTRGE